MGGEIQTIDERVVASVLDWWRDAGVDVAVSDAPKDWLGSAKPATPSRQSAPTPTAKPAPTSAPREKPETLEAFHDWLRDGDDVPAARSGAQRVMPKGVIGAPVMILSDLPAREDAADGQAIGGEAWALAQRMMAAIGVDPAQAYLASLSCFHAPGSRMDRSELDACAELAREHIRLAKPQRLILFGDAPARALTGEPLARARAKVHQIEGVRAVATFHPRWLLQRPSDKALAWKDLQLLMSESV